MTTNIYAEKPFPKLPDNRAAAFVAISMIIMSFSNLLSMVSILVFYAIWFSHLMYKNTFILRPSADFIFLLLLPTLSIFSFLWSNDPGGTLYKGAEFMSMVMCTVMIARLTNVEAFVKGIILGVFCIMTVTLLSGEFSQVYTTGEHALIGYFGSKNMVGFIASIGIILSVMYWFHAKNKAEKIIYALVPCLLFLICLLLSKSAASLVALVVTLGAVGTVFIVSKMQKRMQPLVLFLAVFGVLTVIVSAKAFEFDLTGKALKALGKQPTLTGRTYLWDEGMKIGMEKPFLGHGYCAFWVHGQPDAERLWGEFGIVTKTGFHFHSVYVETFVQMGVLGFILFVLVLFTMALKSVSLALKNGYNLTTGLTLAMAAMFVARSFVEVGVLGPFGVGQLLLFTAFPYAFMYDPDKQQAASLK